MTTSQPNSQQHQMNIFVFDQQQQQQQTQSKNYQEQNILEYNIQQQNINHNNDNIFQFQDIQQSQDNHQNNNNLQNQPQQQQEKLGKYYRKEQNQTQDNFEEQILKNMKKKILLETTKSKTKKRSSQMFVHQQDEYQQQNHLFNKFKEERKFIIGDNEVENLSKKLFAESTNLEKKGEKNKNIKQKINQTIQSINQKKMGYGMKKKEQIVRQDKENQIKPTQLSNKPQLFNQQKSSSKRSSKPNNFVNPNNNNSKTLSQSQKQMLSKMNLDSISIQGAKIFTPSLQAHQKMQYIQQQKAIKVTNMKQFLNTQLSQEYKINALIKKAPSQSIFGSLLDKLTYYVLIQQNNKFLFSVTKDSMGRYIFSLNKDDRSQKNKNYLGKMISKNLSNTQFLLYDDGFDPKQTKTLQFSHKQIASIKYQNTKGPRKFHTIISTNNKGFHSIQNNIDVLDQKWNLKKQRKNLTKIYSKQPQFDQTDRCYKLDYKNMIGKPSIKNFILSSQQYENCLMFTRRTIDTYALEVKHPFSVIQAVGICISSIFHNTIF